MYPSGSGSTHPGWHQPLTRPRLTRTGLVVLTAVLAFGTMALGSAPAYASDPAIAGVVKDTGDVEQPDVLVEVLNPGGGAAVASATTDGGGLFHVPVPGGV